MAEVQQFRLPNGQTLNAETITNLYLYSQENTPPEGELLSSDLIRLELEDLNEIPGNPTEVSAVLPANATVSEILVDAEPYMSSGPGRFANGTQFDLVRGFFGLGKEEMLTSRGREFLLEDIDLPPGTYDKDDIDERLFQGDVENEDGTLRGLGGFSSSIELRNYVDDISTSDSNNDGVSEYAESIYI